MSTRKVVCPHCQTGWPRAGSPEGPRAQCPACKRRFRVDPLPPAGSHLLTDDEAPPRISLVPWLGGAAAIGLAAVLVLLSLQNRPTASPQSVQSPFPPAKGPLPP